ncbi:hypothetical protein NIES2119_30040 [[Phormidium ambiguum] IAM M-71]|uniref:DNA polymerase I n=1 Tax=[Phormidium ambiguum] IAM M-71 TaxID=454136 RepID=A0A1U7I485_9CYAN|nr:DNA polymerase [Phormidium ambiguum]OKH30916.1 hypothetical protein NIES2119_30040 [Phormidium ambiguum IAM M-71]
MPQYFQYTLFLQQEESLKSNIVLLDNPLFPELFREWKQAKRFGFDLETFGNSGESDSALDPNTGEIRLISLAFTIDSKVWVLLIDNGFSNEQRIQIEQQLHHLGFWETLAERLANPTVEVVGHSLDFEQQWMLAKYGYKIRCIRDTKLMSQVYWAGLDPWLDKVNNKAHSLASVCLRLGIEIDKSEQKSEWGWGDKGGGELSNNQLNYAGLDAEVVLQIHDRLEPLLKEIGVWNSYMAECSASPAFAQMAYYGMPVNEAALSSVTLQYETAYQDLVNKLGSTFPEAVPYLYSTKELPKLINQRFKLKLTQVNADSLSKYWDIPELRLISVIKTTKTYLDYLINLKESLRDGYVRSHYTQINRAAFGRSSSQHPNLQNPPNPSNFPDELQAYNLPAIRTVFVAHPGTSLIVSDLSKAHTRIACEASSDAQLIGRLNSESQEIFCSIASAIAFIQGLGDDWTEDNIRIWVKDKSHANHQTAAMLRAVSKNVHYGSMNLQGFKTLQRTIRTGSGISLTDKEAQSSQSGWKKTYAGVAAFCQKIIREANCTLPSVLGIEEIKRRTKFGLGYVRCLTGRGVFLPLYPQEFGENKCVSVKGPDATAAFWTMAEADIMKLALGEIIARLDSHPEYGAHLGNMAHDEVDAIANSDYSLEVATIIQSSMRYTMRQFIHCIPVDEGESAESLICDSWAQK